MGFFLLTRSGESFYITAESLRERLLSNNPTILEQTSETSENLLSLEYLSKTENPSELDVFLGKLGFSDLVIGPKEISFLFERFSEFDEESLDLLSSMFTFERTHFLSIIYLFNKKMITIEEVKDLVNSNSKNRTELLLSFLSREKNEINIFTPFYNSLERYFYKRIDHTNFNNIIFSSKIGTKTISRNFLWYFSVIKLLGIFNYSNTAFNHVQWKDPMDPWQRILFFAALAIGIAVVLAAFVVVPASLILWTVGISTLLTILTDAVSLPYTTLSSFDFYNSFFNKFYPAMIINEFFINRNSSNLYSSIRERQLKDFYIRDSVASSLSQNDPVKQTSKPTRIPFYAYMYWVYENYNNIINTEIDFLDFNNNYDNPFRKSLRDDVNKIYCVFGLSDYLPRLPNGSSKYPSLCSTLNSIFPNMNRYIRAEVSVFQSSEITDILVGEYDVNNRRLISNSSRVNSIRTILSDLFDSDYNIRDNAGSQNNGEIISLGKKNTIPSVIESIKRAMTSLGISELDIKSREGLNIETIRSYVLDLKAKIIPEILNQSISTPSDAFFKIILGDVLEDYLDYLVDKNRTSFNTLKVKPETIKIYRLLKFLRLYFSKSLDANNILKKNGEYQRFLSVFNIDSESIDQLPGITGGS
jgi:hypothetical protein